MAIFAGLLFRQTQWMQTAGTVILLCIDMGTENTQLRQAWDFIENTGRSVFLTGKAGTGKTTFLRTVVEKCRKQAVVLAPTGIAAINAGGVTIHSFFQLPLAPYLPGTSVKTMFAFGREKRKLIASLDMIIIDEISMVRCDLLDAMDAVLRHFRDWSKPFGGVQLLMIGDLAQLTPVVTAEDEVLLKQAYDTPYFFGSKALAQVDYVTIELQHIYRQQDLRFVDILNHVRCGQLDSTDINALNSRYVPNFVPAPEEGYIRLTTHNNIADSQNNIELQRLSGREYTYRAEIEGTFPEYSYPTSPDLRLRVGAQVMFVRNDSSPQHLYYNGMIGRVVYADNEEIRVMPIGENQMISVERAEWENKKYSVNNTTHEIDSEVLGVFRQYPLRLAWAITIHKSQGLTFDRAVIDANRSFAPGQVYVALSRCRTLEGMVLSSPLSPSAIIGDERVDTFMAGQEDRARISITRLPDLKEEYHRQLIFELFDFAYIVKLEETLLRLLVEYCSSSYATLVMLHKSSVADLRTQVTDVAAKWRTAIASMTPPQLHEQQFLERVGRSAAYFASTLVNLLERPLEITAGVKTDNKVGMRRITDVCGDLLIAWRAKVALLNVMSERRFSTSAYLEQKRRTVIDAMDGGSDKQKKKRTEKKSRQKYASDDKLAKEKTWVTSYRLFREGKTPAEIAVIRRLTTATIIGHLARYVETGQLDLKELLDEEIIKVVRRAVTMALEHTPNGSRPSLSDIKSLCPPEITFTDIRLVCAHSDIANTMF